MMTEWQTRRDEILMHILTDIPFDGWTDQALRRIYRDHEISATDQQLLFPRAIRDVLAHLSDWADRQMLASIENNPDFAIMRIRDKIAFGVMARLEALAPWRLAVEKSLPLLAQPMLARQALKSTWQSADRLWRTAGDTSTDYNYYTKRSLLMGVITSTTLFWVHDKSEDSNRTRTFLANRIEQVLGLGRLMSHCRRQPQTKDGSSQMPAQGA